jgi:hypothetical protein
VLEKRLFRVVDALEQVILEETIENELLMKTFSLTFDEN